MVCCDLDKYLSNPDLGAVNKTDEGPDLKELPFPLGKNPKQTNKVFRSFFQIAENTEDGRHE